MFKTNFIGTGLLLLITVILSTNVNAKNEVSKSSEATYLKSSINANKLIGPITMIESILRVDTGNPKNPIQTVHLIKVSQFYAKVLTGCGQSKCHFSLKSFPKGLYKVIVYAENGKTFQRTIQIN